MTLSTSYISSRIAAMRTTLTGSTVTIRHESWEYSGTRLPHQQGELVDEAGAMFTVTGGLRLIVSELAPVWPKAGDQIDVRIGEKQWQTFVIIADRLDEAEASMLITYGERYDQEGI